MDHFYDNFLAVLEERYPRKPDLVNALMDVLCLEKESIYRRLRKGVYFSAEEVMKVAGAWNISLDNIISINPEKTRPLRFKMVDFVHPWEEDYRMLEQHNHDIGLVAGDPEGKMVEVVNAMSRGLYARSEHLTRFFTMKWLHKCDPEGALVFGDIHLSERMKALDAEYLRQLHAIPEIHSIHDNRLIVNLIDDIVYYRSIGMLTQDEAILLQGELLKLADYIEEVTKTGYLPGRKTRLFFYLSHTWIETEYILFKSKHLNMSLVKILERNSIASTDEKILDKFMNMVRATKHMSVLMSESNALQQAEFFTKQREIIMTL